MLCHGLPCHADKSRGRGIRFKASLLPAGAGLSVCHNGHVTQLAGGTGKPGEQLAAQHHAAPHTGTQGDHHCALGALGSPYCSLRQGGGVGIVHQSYAVAGQLPQGGAHIVVYPPEIAGIDHRALLVIHCAGAAHAHAADGFALRQSANHGGNGFRHRLGPCLRMGGGGTLLQNFACFTDQGALDVGATQVNANIPLHGYHSRFLPVSLLNTWATLPPKMRFTSLPMGKCVAAPLVGTMTMTSLPPAVT